MSGHRGNGGGLLSKEHRKIDGTPSWLLPMATGSFSVPIGYKLSEPDQLEADLSRPGGIIKIERLKRGEPQPIYQKQNFGPDLK